MRLVLLLSSLAVLALGCSQTHSRVEEITFRSGPFKVVGDLRLPNGEGPHPVVVFVHGDGPNNRTSGVTYPPIMERMRRARYATFAWDKPGTGESTGEFDHGRVVGQRAQIVLDAIATLQARHDIDADRIGLWGISQAGYVMPQVLEQTDDIAFMIAISCPGAPGVEQGIYLLASQMVCAGRPAKDLELIRRQIRAFTMATTYEEYVKYKTPLTEDPAFVALAKYGQRIEVGPREDWHPADPAREYYGYDPMDIIARTSIPVLAVFGEKDTQADPVQGVQAYREALASAGNPLSRAVLVPEADHNILRSETGCMEERSRRSTAGWRNYPPEYLALIEQWLTELRE